MAKLFYIESSPRKERSASIAVARHFLTAYRDTNSLDTVESLDLWHTLLPRFDAAAMEAKYAILHGQSHTEEQRKAWQAIEKIVAQFKSADKYLISVPMWNFSVPYVLKHYLDVLVQPGLTFSFSPSEGYKGLVTGKPMAIVCARGGAYGAGTGAESQDHQIAYLKQILRFIGFTKPQIIVIEPTLASPEARENTLAAAKQKAEELARKF